MYVYESEKQQIFEIETRRDNQRIAFLRHLFNQIALIFLRSPLCYLRRACEQKKTIRSTLFLEKSITPPPPFTSPLYANSLLSLIVFLHAFARQQKIV